MFIISTAKLPFLYKENISFGALLINFFLIKQINLLRLFFNKTEKKSFSKYKGKILKMNEF